MKNVYIEKINNIINEEKITNLKFIQGLKIYDITQEKNKKSLYKKRPYLIYQGIKNNQKIILKILIRKNYFNFFKKELFIYKSLLKISPQLRKYLPELIKYNDNFEKHAPFFIFKFYDDFKTLGKSYLLEEKINKKQLKKILDAIDLFHIKKSYFLNYENFSFYYQKYIKRTKEILKKILSLKELNKLESFFIKTRSIFLKAKKYLCWGDVNPANILIKKTRGNFEFKFIDFEKADYAPLFRDYTTFFYAIYLKDKKLASYFISYLKEKFKNIDFWILFYFKLLIYSLPMQFNNLKNQRNDFLVKKIKEMIIISINNFYFYFKKYENSNNRL